MTANAATPGDAQARLTGQRLWFVRVVWFAALAFVLPLLIISIPLRAAHLQKLCSEANCGFGRLTSAEVQALEQAGFSLNAYVAYNVAIDTLFILVFFTVAVIIFWRRPDDWMAVYVSLFLLIFPLGPSNVLELVSAGYPTFKTLGLLLNSLGGVMLGIFFYLFPDGRFAPRWTRWLVPFLVIREFMDPFSPQSLISTFLFTATFVTFLYAQVYRYWRVSGPVQRQQTKWFVYGTTVAISGIVMIFLLYDFGTPIFGLTAVLTDTLAATAIRLLILIMPLSLMMSILRYHLWEIDIIINRTLVYAPLTAILAGVLAVFSDLARRLFLALTGKETAWSPIVATLVVVAVFDPIRKALQGFVDRRFKSSSDPAIRLAPLRVALETRVSVVNAQQVARRLLTESVAVFGAKGGAVYLQRAEQLELVHTVGEWQGNAELTIPLEANDKQLGMAMLSKRRNGAEYTAKDRATLLSIAQIVAQAIEQDAEHKA